MKRRLKIQLKRLSFLLFKFASRLNLHVLPKHYYSSFADLRELEKTREAWARRSELPGLVINLDQQCAKLRQICLPFQSEFQGNPAYQFARENEFGPGFGYIEAQALHGVIRCYKPRRIVEVGSGVSSWCMRHAANMNRAETGHDCAITCIEPYPTRQLRQLADIQLIARPVQTVGFDEAFAQLAENDLLFIDSSHTVKPGGDVNYLYLEILPRLNPGVIIQIHDIYLPYDYSRDVLQTYFQWMETALLRAWLIDNPRAAIIFCMSQLHYDRQETLREIFPEYRPQKDELGLRDRKYKPFENPSDEHFPCSIYIRIQSS